VKAAALLVAALAVACTQANIRQCEDNSTCNYQTGGECRVNAATGNQWCSFPDHTCPSGFRWGDATVGDDLAGTCVDGDDVPDASPAAIDASPCDGVHITWIRESRIWIARPDGSEARRLNADVVFAGSPPSNGVWSPSGDLLAFANQGAIWTMDRAGGGAAPLTPTGGDSCGRPAWSPDGQTLAFECNDGTRTVIAKVSRAGGNPIPLSTGTLDGVRAEWSPDGSRIAFVSGSGDIYTMTADGLDERNLTMSAAVETRPRWSTAGKIAYTSNEAGGDHWTMDDDDGGDKINLNSNSTYFNHRWSPDGSRLLVQRLITGFETEFAAYGPTGGSNVVISSVDGVDGFNVDPVYSPDGSQIAWARAEAPDFVIPSIWVADADGSNPVEITTPSKSGLGDWSPAWQPCNQ
jgi:Tol biopolymer transport system component